jgi:hypothetical protein
MPSSAGPNTTGESNIVFSYDTGDTSNSYRGEPTVNIHANSEDVNSWTGNLFNNWINSGVSSNTVVAPNGTLTGDIIGDGFGRFNASSTAIPGQAYTYSVYLKNVTLTSGFYIWYAFGLNEGLVTYGQALFVPITSINPSEWIRFSVTVTAPGSGINQVQFGPCPFTGYNYGSTYSSPTYNSSGAQLAVWGGQIEQKSHVTPYTSGTRSSTQGLLPLIGNSTLDLTNMSFNSNAQMYFDGTDDYISCGTLSLDFSQGITVEAIANFTNVGSWQRIMDFGNGSASNNILLSRYGSSDDLWFEIYNGTSSTSINTSLGILYNQLCHYVVTVNGATAYVYRNGVLINSGTFATVPTTISRTNCYIGKSNWADAYYQGIIPITKLYNTALSANQVKQNYQQYKSRFNLS